MSEDWRVETNGLDYLRGQQKRVAIEQRRPVIRKASDLVGPGINLAATRITDYNDILATFNGYYSSEPGALYAPNSTDSFVGFVAMDALLGGVQEFTSLDTGVEYRRVFARSPGDEESISFGAWQSEERVPATAFTPTSTNVAQQLTDFDANTPIVMTMPLMEFIGQPGTFIREETKLNIARQGIYSGYFWWRTTDDIAINYLQIEFPNGPIQTYDVLYNLTSDDGIMVPLHFVATTGTGFIRVTGYQAVADNKIAEFERLHLTRLGDAV
jgi:hypothetical protein